MKNKCRLLVVLIGSFFLFISSHPNYKTVGNDIENFLMCMQEYEYLDSIIQGDRVFIVYTDKIVNGMSHRVYNGDDRKPMYLVTKSYIFFYKIEEYLSIVDIQYYDSTYSVTMIYKYDTDDEFLSNEFVIEGECSSLVIR